MSRQLGRWGRQLRRGSRGQRGRRRCQATPSRRCRTGPAAQGSRRLLRQPRALYVRDSPHLDRWFRPTPRATTSTSQCTSTPTDSRCRVRIARSGSRREKRRPPARQLPQVMSPRTYRDRSAGTGRATSRLRSCCAAGARAKRLRVDGSEGAATGPTTVSEVTQGKDCPPAGDTPRCGGPRSKLPIPSQQSGGGW